MSYTDDKKTAIKKNVRFVDSFKFMPHSLDELLKNLKSYPNLRRFYRGEQLQLLLKKGVYPYDYVDSLKWFNETQLPPKEAFCSKLKGQGISDDAYTHAPVVWTAFWIYS